MAYATSYVAQGNSPTSPLIAQIETATDKQSKRDPV
jgi:hypothetical protein